MLLCIDIGNTQTDIGLLDPGGQTTAHSTTTLPTAELGEIDSAIRSLSATEPLAGIAFCSVVPAATERLTELLAPHEVPLWQLTHAVDLGVPIHYPKPSEIGQDRLANAAGACALSEPPVVVIDLGTAVTFDIISQRRGYEGGIITPGPALMTRYLHERTAQLPWVEDISTSVSSAIGKSTQEAIRIGAALGFVGAIQACLDGIESELLAAGESTPRVITAGGAAELISDRLRQSTTDIPHLALRGLAAAWNLNHPTTTD
jgi:type III pantothenate kinase